MITLVAFVVLYIAGVILAVVKRPVFGLYTYLLAFYFNPVGTWWGSGLPELRWSLMAAAATVGGVIYHNRNLREELKFPGFNPALILFAAWILLQSFWALHANMHKEFQTIVINFVVLYWMILRTCTSKTDINWFILCNAIGCAYLGWYAGSLGRSGRLEGIGPPGLHDANFLALHLAAILIMVGFILIGMKDKKKYLILPLLLLILNGIMLTQSRGAMVGMIMAGVFTLVYLPKEFRLQLIFYGVLGIGAMFVVMDDRFAERLRSTVSTDNEDGMEKSAYSRIVIMKAQWEMFKSRPLFGSGHRGTLVLSPQYIDQAYMTESGGQSVRASHNTYMSVLVEQGIVGAVLYIWLITSAFRRVHTMLNKKARIADSAIKALALGVGASLFGTLAAVFFVDGLRLEIIIWQIALIYALYFLNKQLLQAEEKEETEKEVDHAQTADT